MKITRLYTDNFIININRNKDEIISDLNKFITRNKTHSFLDRFLVGQKLNLTDDVLEIIRTNNFFEPFRGGGQIKCKLSTINNSKTKLDCEISPIINGNYSIYYFAASCLIVWTIISLFILKDRNTILIICMAWAITLSIIHFFLQWKKVQLRKFTKAFIKKEIL